MTTKIYKGMPEISARRVKSNNKWSKMRYFNNEVLRIGRLSIVYYVYNKRKMEHRSQHMIQCFIYRRRMKHGKK